MATMDPDFAPFWEATSREELAVQRCDQCGTVRWPPRPCCAKCGSDEASWVPVEGRGRVYSWVVVHRAAQERMRARAPYVVLIVELDEAPGLRFVGGLAHDDEDAELSIGLPVQVQLQKDEDGRTRPYWSVAP
jgi:uncharacterized OB-fold protein